MIKTISIIKSKGEETRRKRGAGGGSRRFVGLFEGGAVEERDAWLWVGVSPVPPSWPAHCTAENEVPEGCPGRGAYTRRFLAALFIVTKNTHQWGRA